jgi:hypothetical protein
MEGIVTAAGITLEQIHHGYGMACWAVNQRGLERGHGIRTGLEDVTLLPDGKQARDNADLVAAAARLIRAHEDLGSHVDYWACVDVCQRKWRR